jgi:protein TonB
MMTAAVPPIYPPEAKEKKLEGIVRLRAIIGRDGAISNLTVVEATDPIFIDAAKAAVERWKYRPYILNGEPTDVETTITVNFTMGKPPAPRAQ